MAGTGLLESISHFPKPSEGELRIKERLVLLSSGTISESIMGDPLELLTVTVARTFCSRGTEDTAAPAMESAIEALKAICSTPYDTLEFLNTKSNLTCSPDPGSVATPPVENCTMIFARDGFAELSVIILIEGDAGAPELIKI